MANLRIGHTGTSTVMAEAVAAAPAVDPRLWMLVSPTLPVGGYSYSQGIEHAVLCGRIHDAAGAESWVSGLLEASVTRVDLPILARLYQALARSDLQTAARWNRELHARRETAELRQEDLLMGEALERLIADLTLPAPDRLEEPATFALALARASLAFGVGLEACLTACGWIWCDNQIAAAVKLVPLGQTDGQRVLLRLTEQLTEAVATALSLDDREIGGSAPGLALMSSAHESQETRLFRS